MGSRRPYKVILMGRATRHGKADHLFERTHTFAKQTSAYGCALDFVVHGPIHNRALIRLNDKPFMQIERQGGHITTVKVNWSGE